MNTAENLLVILLFLSALYTTLGLLCGIAETLQDLLARPHQRRRLRRSLRRRTPRRAVMAIFGGAHKKGMLGGTMREKAA